jgi:hypothetical protein
MTPEQSMRAHLDLQGKIMMPIHNGTFDLAFHAWYDPFEQITAQAKLNKVELTTPIMGQVITAQTKKVGNLWWRK